MNFTDCRHFWRAKSRCLEWNSRLGVGDATGGKILEEQRRSRVRHICHVAICRNEGRTDANLSWKSVAERIRFHSPTMVRIYTVVVSPNYTLCYIHLEIGNVQLTIPGTLMRQRTEETPHLHFRTKTLQAESTWWASQKQCLRESKNFYRLTICSRPFARGIHKFRSKLQAQRTDSDNGNSTVLGYN